MTYRRLFGSAVFAAFTSGLVAAPTTKASLLTSVNISQNCSPVICKIGQSIKAMTTHEIELSPAEEAALLSDAVINVSGGFSFSFALSSDPNFQNGDKSAKLKTIIPIPPPATGSAFTSVSAKWGNGKLTVRGIQSFKIKQESLVPTVSPEDKAVPTATVTTTITNGGGTVASASAPVIVATKTNQQTQVRTDGSVSLKIQTLIKGNKLAP